MDLSGAAWRKSTYSGGNGGQCVEVAVIASNPGGPEMMCAVRDSKEPAGPVLAFGSGSWCKFTGEVKAGRFGLA